MAFAAARMILKDKRRKSKEDFAPPRQRSKARSVSTSSFRSLSQGDPHYGHFANSKYLHERRTSRYYSSEYGDPNFERFHDVSLKPHFGMHYKLEQKT